MSKDDFDFDRHLETILKEETSEQLRQQGFIPETFFVHAIAEKYRLSTVTVKGRLRRMCGDLDLQRRRMSDELKKFYGVEITGFPVIYQKAR